MCVVKCWGVRFQADIFRLFLIWHRKYTRLAKQTHQMQKNEDENLTLCFFVFLCLSLSPPPSLSLSPSL